MKVAIFIFAIVLTGVISQDAQAQDATMMSVNAATNVTTNPPSTRTPVLVVHEQPKVVNNTPPTDIAKTAGLANNVVTNAKTLSTLKDAPAKALNPNAAKSPTPMYIANGSQPAVEIIPTGVETTGNPAYDKLVHEAAAR